ncbi:hypothetical protein TKK_0016648 [Trichogramma kaykai]
MNFRRGVESPYIKSNIFSLMGIVPVTAGVTPSSSGLHSGHYASTAIGCNIQHFISGNFDSDSIALDSSDLHRPDSSTQNELNIFNVSRKNDIGLLSVNVDQFNKSVSDENSTQVDNNTSEKNDSHSTSFDPFTDTLEINNYVISPKKLSELADTSNQYEKPEKNSEENSAQANHNTLKKYDSIPTQQKKFEPAPSKLCKDKLHHLDSLNDDVFNNLNASIYCNIETPSVNINQSENSEENSTQAKHNTPEKDDSIPTQKKFEPALCTVELNGLDTSNDNAIKIVNASANSNIETPSVNINQCKNPEENSEVNSTQAKHNTPEKDDSISTQKKFEPALLKLCTVKLHRLDTSNDNAIKIVNASANSNRETPLVNVNQYGKSVPNEDSVSSEHITSEIDDFNPTSKGQITGKYLSRFL